MVFSRAYIKYIYSNLCYLPITILQRHGEVFYLA
jgi:hypothetical protein